MSPDQGSNTPKQPIDARNARGIVSAGLGALGGTIGSGIFIGSQGCIEEAAKVASAAIPLGTAVGATAAVLGGLVGPMSVRLVKNNWWVAIGGAAVGAGVGALVGGAFGALATQMGIVEGIVIGVITGGISGLLDSVAF
jgi:hypothetical protein